MNDITTTIHHVERLYESITGRPAPGPATGAQNPIPPERDPQQYVEEQLDRLTRMLAPGFDASAIPPAWVPEVALWENAESFVFLIDVPGVARSDLVLRVGPEHLEVQGTRSLPALDTAAPLQPCWYERREGTFQRMLPLPTGASAHDVLAELRDGVLVVRVGRSERNAPPSLRKIDVR